MIPTPTTNPDPAFEAGAALEHVSDAVAVVDQDWQCLYFNAAFERIVGRDRQQMLGKNCWELAPAAVGTIFEDQFRRAMAQQVSVEFEAFYPRLCIWVEARAFPSPHTLTIFFRDITRQKQADEALETAGRAKDHFLAILSHELRTPLAPVLATAQIMEADATLSPEQQEAMSMIRRNVEVQARLIDDLLDLTRIARGKFKLTFTTVDLHEHLRHVLAICESDIAGKQLKMTVATKATHHFVSADGARLQQIFWNILKNAVKFTPVGGTITIRAYNPDDDHVVVSIQDTGIGIEPEVLPLIFNAFEQGGTVVTRQFGGLGLGLTISKGLVDLHGGTLIAESEGKGKGATFTLTLRTATDTQSQRPHAAGTESLRALATGQRVLLVEDHADTAKAMSSVLEKRYGFVVSLAYSVEEAMKLAESSPFDLLISDIGLPDGSGLDVIRQVAAIKPIKAIAISGFGTEEDIRKSKEAGFLAHLTKPVTLTVLERVLVEALAAPQVEPESP